MYFVCCLLFTPVPSHADVSVTVPGDKIKKACGQLKILEKHYSDNYITNTEYFSNELNQTIDKTLFYR